MMNMGREEEEEEKEGERKEGSQMHRQKKCRGHKKSQETGSESFVGKETVKKKVT